MFLFIVSSFKSFLNLVTPFIKDSFELRNHFLIWRPCRTLVFNFIIPFSVILIESNVGLKTFQCFSKLISELIKDRYEFFFLFIFALAPVRNIKSVNERFVDLVNDRIQRCNCIFRYLTKQYLIIILTVRVYGLACWKCPEEIHSLSFKFNFFTVSYKKFLVTSMFNNISRVSDLVWNLIINKYSAGSISFQKIINKVWSMIFLKSFLSIILSNTENIHYNRSHPFGSWL